jgi:hypothetical protein
MVLQCILAMTFNVLSIFNVLSLYSYNGGGVVNDTPGHREVDIDKDGFITMASGHILVTNNLIDRLEISGANLGVVDVKTLAHVLKMRWDIKRLFMTGFRFSDVDFLFDAFAECPDLEGIVMHDCGLTNVDRLAAALVRNHSIRYLQLTKNPIEDAAPLMALTHLGVLIIDDEVKNADVVKRTLVNTRFTIFGNQ